MPKYVVMYINEAGETAQRTVRCENAQAAADRIRRSGYQPVTIYRLEEDTWQ